MRVEVRFHFRPVSSRPGVNLSVGSTEIDMHGERADLRNRNACGVWSDGHDKKIGINHNDH